jgi:hypothetical protein
MNSSDASGTCSSRPCCRSTVTVRSTSPRFGGLLAYASRGTTLRPGDIIGSGTVGTGCILELATLHGTRAYPWLKPGDTVRLEVAELGVIESAVVPGPPVIPLR